MRVTADTIRHRKYKSLLYYSLIKISSPFLNNRYMHYVYILNCKNDEPYTGCTQDLKERIERHKNKQVPATAEKQPIKLISYFAFQNKNKAFNFEKYLKSGSGRAFLNKHF